MLVADLIKILGDCNPEAIIYIEEHEVSGYEHFSDNKVNLIYVIPDKESK